MGDDSNVSSSKNAAPDALVPKLQLWNLNEEFLGHTLLFV